MKKFVKPLVIAICAVLLVAGSVAGTLAYLTATSEAVTNTFTVGNITIALDEAQVDVYGEEVAPDSRVKDNSYKLVPGRTYKKDPTIHVTKGSEACYLFVKIENNIADVVTTDSVAAQLTNNRWTLLTGNVYYYENVVDASTAEADVDVAVFESFAVDAEAESADIADCNGKTIVVTAYAVQSHGFDDATDAWVGTFGKT